jgi:hypothetical protein
MFDGLDGARTWCGQGVFAHDVVHSMSTPCPQPGGRSFAVLAGAGTLAGVANQAGDRCRWRVRDLPTWRAGILFNASADLLVAWHTAALTAGAKDWTATKRRFGAAVAQVK